MRLPDLHIHTNFSDGDLPAAVTVSMVRHMHKWVGVADHLSPYHIMWDEPSFKTYLNALSRLKCWRAVELCVGHVPEFDINFLRELDYIIAGVHALQLPNGKNAYLWDSRLTPEDPDLIAELYINSIREFATRCHFDILAHPTYLPKSICATNPWTHARQEHLIEILLNYNIALEISGHWKVPDETLIKMAQEAGVKLSTGSDGHSEATLGDLDYPSQCVDRLQIKEHELFFPSRKL